MRYFFDGRIVKQDNLYSIRIPFNVWEVSRMRDVIQADIVLDNKIIDCELLPQSKGNYIIHLQEEDISHIDINQTHKILLHINRNLIQMNQNSP